MKRFAVVLLLALAACRPSSDPALPAPSLTFSAPTWPEPAWWPGAGAGRLVLSNSRDDTLSVLDATKVGQAAVPEVARVPVGLNPVEIEAPHHAAIAPDGSALYVNLSEYAPGTGTGPHGSHGVGTVDGKVLKLDGVTGRLLGTVRVDRNSGDLEVGPDGKVVAVTHYDLLRIQEAQAGTAPSPDARVVLIDTASMTQIAAVAVCAAPHGVRFSKDGKRLYVACYSDEVAVVQLDAQGFPVTRIKVAANAGTAFDARQTPYALSVSPLTGDVFVSCPKSGDVRVLTAALTMDESRRTLLGGQPQLSGFSPDGMTLWVPTQGDDRIHAVDPLTGARLRSLNVPRDQCKNVHQVLAMADGASLAVVCEGDHVSPGSLLVLGTDGAVKSVTAVGTFPDYIGLWRTP